MMTSLDLEKRKKKKSRRTEILLGQERMLKGIVSKCVVMVKQPQVVQSQLSPFLRNKKKNKNAGSLCTRAGWSSRPVLLSSVFVMSDSSPLKAVAFRLRVLRKRSMTHSWCWLDLSFITMLISVSRLPYEKACAQLLLRAEVALIHTRTITVEWEKKKISFGFEASIFCHAGPGTFLTHFSSIFEPCK